MTHDRSRGGFTLVELIVAIAAASLVTMAALTLLLVGVRVNRTSVDALKGQNTVRILVNALEEVSTEGNITRLEIGTGEEDGASQEGGDAFWIIYGQPGQKQQAAQSPETQPSEDTEQADETVETDIPLFTYISSENTIYAGKYIPPVGEDGEESEENVPLLEGVQASSVSINEEGNLLTFSVTMPNGEFSTSIFCRTTKYEKDEENPGDHVAEKPEDAVVEKTTEAARTAFLKALTSQYRLRGGGPNPGLILDEYLLSTGVYYAEWYINNPFNKEWNGETPWCACYISWALSQVSDQYIQDPIGFDVTKTKLDDKGEIEEYVEHHWFASVDRFKKALMDTENNKGHVWKLSEYYANPTLENDAYVPQPGDIIFIDWEGDNDPDHVGVVVALEEDKDDPRFYKYVYTIEGNSAGIVAVRRYEYNDAIINGYGVINWTLTETPESEPEVSG